MQIFPNIKGRILMMESDTSLENETRKLIYNHIMSNPGVSFIVLKNVFKLNDSTLRYHLNYLEKSEKISFGVEKGSRYYYPHLGGRHIIHKSQVTGTLSAYELSGIQEKIISAIKRNPKINQKQLIKITRINRITLNNNLKKLTALCLVRKVPNGNKVQYEYIENQQLRYEILKHLIKKLLNNQLDEATFLKLKRELD
jgi:predicted transcriptional regulator